MSSSTVTVVIPTFNRSGWLRESLEQVLEQTRRPDVVLVADNGSTDDTPEVMHEFERRPGVRYVRRPSNIDPLVSHNDALARVDTDYVVIVFDDDRIYPDFLRETTRVLDAEPRVGVVHTSFDLIDEVGASIRPDVNLIGIHEGVAREAGADFIREHMLERWRVGIALSRTKALRTAGFYPTGVSVLLADMLMWMEVAVEWDLTAIGRTLGALRHHVKSLTAQEYDYTETAYVSSRASADEYLEAREAFVERHRAQLDSPDELLRLARRGWRLDRVSNTTRTTYPDRPRGRVTSELWDTFSRDRRTALEPSAWRLLLVSLAGRRSARLARNIRTRLRRRP